MDRRCGGGCIQLSLVCILRAIEDGLYQPSMKTRLEVLEAEKAALTYSRDTSPALPNVSVHPNLAAVYRTKVEELESLLGHAEFRDEALELIRSLIERIELTPREEGGLDAILHGDLARILVLCSTGMEQAVPRGTICVAGSKRNEALAGVTSRGLFL